MKKILQLSMAILITSTLYGQAPVVYFNFVSHNEPKDSLHNSFVYFQSKTKCTQLANLILSKNAAWNIGTCDYFIDGAINHDNATVNTGDIFETLSSSAYTNNIEIDARTKNHLGRNTADAVYMLNSCGATASKNLSGFTWFSSNPLQIDWWPYSDTLTGNIYGNKWKANIIWGGGSPGHSNDLNDYGIWKPDTTTNFYSHNPNRTLWFEGNGCAPKLDTLTNEQDIITQLRNLIDSIQGNDLPQNKFYCFTITFGQNEFGTTLFNQISTICDSVNSWGSSKIQWATLTQKFSYFQTWQVNTSLDYSQLLCGQTTTGIHEEGKLSGILVYPNPSAGKYSINFNDKKVHRIRVINITGLEIITAVLNENGCVDLSEYPKGVYCVIIDNKYVTRLIKK